MKILFICKYNRFRSRVAEALFNHYNKNKNIEAKSAGILFWKENPYIADNTLAILEKKGVKVRNRKSVSINDKLMNWADKIIVAANNVPAETFPENVRSKVEIWPIMDASEYDIESIERSVDEIEKRVKNLVSSTEKA